jgi:hypothetical protein
MMLQLVAKLASKVLKINPQDFLTQDTVRFLIDVAKEAIKP